MMKISLLIWTLSLVCFHCQSQSVWKETRDPYPFLEDKKDYALNYLYYGIHYDYKYDEEGQFICDITYHVIARPINDDGLESINRIYIPIRNVIDILDIRSRVISTDGVVKELDRNNIKEIKDEETEGGYRMFAVEGAEVEGEIEYRYVKRVYGSTFINEVIQFTFPINELEFTLTCPENLEFEFLTANDTSQVVKTDEVDTLNRYQVVLEQIPGFYSEPFSGFDANKKRIDFRLAYNSTYGKKRINTFSDAGKKIYDQAHDLSKAETKLISDFIKEHDGSGGDPIEKLKVLEHEIKKKYYEEKYTPDDIVFLFENGFGSKIAFLKLFVAFVEHLGLDYEIVATSNRLESKFHLSFDSWNYLDDYLLYFPEQDEFLSVHDYNERYGSVSYENTATLGVFVHPEMITDFIYPVTRQDYIPAASYDRNMNNLDIKVSFNKAISKSIIEAKRIYLGNEASYYKSALFWMDQEQKDEMLDDLVHYLAPNADILEVEISQANNSVQDWFKPFIVACKYESESFIESGGSSLLFKAGELIGLQSELYMEEERIYEIENTNNRGYRREIVVDLPKGYEVQNPDDILLDEKVYVDDEPVYVFESSYKLNGNQLVISIDEYYDKIFYPKEGFEEFRKVINAAADWNKVTLVLKEI